MTIHLLHEKALTLAKKYLQTEAELVAVLQEIDKKKVFVDLGYSSLYTYCLQALKLSESQTKIFIGVARKCLEHPQLNQAVRSGELNISKAKRILPVIDKENSQIWIEKAKTLPQRELEFQVAARVPDAAAVQVIKPVSETLTRLVSDIPHALAEDIERVRELVVRETGRSASVRDALEAMVRVYLEKKDPVARAKRLVARRQAKAEKAALNGAHRAPTSGECLASKAEKKGLRRNTNSSRALPSGECVKRPAKKPQNARFIPAEVAHQVQVRDQGRCCFKNPDGSRCSNRIFLQLHHIRPVAAGGRGELENLVTLCGNHHRFWHHEHERRLRGFLRGPGT